MVPRRREPRYDCYTKNRIIERISGLSDQELINREYERATKRVSLIREWERAGFAQRHDLRRHIDDCIRLVDFDLSLIHEAMRKRGIKTWAEVMEEERYDFMECMKNEEFKKK